MLFGSHMSTGGGVWKAFERGEAAGCDIIQIFVKNNMQWEGKPYDQEDCRRFAQAWEHSSIATVFGHTGYLINLGAPNGPNRDKSIASLIQEIRLANALRVPFLVLHPGAHLGEGEAAGLRRIVAGLNQVLRATRRSQVRIALENTAGQGSCLGYRIAHLADIYAGVDAPERLGVCIDTAHLFAAGYDIRTPAGWRKALKEVADAVGLDQILAFHLNDSKTELDSRVDRHAHIGKGHIGTEGFRHIVNDRRFRTLPGCLETPKSPDLHEDVENLAVLRELCKTPARRRN